MIQSEDDIPKRIGIQDMDGTRYMIFGSLFILGVNATLFPLDTITTIMMADDQLRKKSIFKLIYRIAKKEGIVRFWKGLGASLLGAFPGQSTYYYTYESAQYVLNCAFPTTESAKYPTFLKGFVSGALAEFMGGAFYVPADVVSQRLQVQSTHGLNFTKNSRLYTGPMDVAKRILKYEGIRGFYRGYLAYLCAYAPGSAVQWGSYELTRGFLFKSITLMEKSKWIPQLSQKENIVNGTSGGLAAFCAVCANNPLEVVRVRHQLLDSTNPKHKKSINNGYLNLAKKIVQDEGYLAFYKGLRVRMFVAIPTAMVAMSGYETVKSWSKD